MWVGSRLVKLYCVHTTGWALMLVYYKTLGLGALGCFRYLPADLPPNPPTSAA